MTNRRGRRRGTRRGGVAVELALVLPLLLVFSMLCIDIGRLAYTSIAVASGARAGASYGSTHQYASSSQSVWEKGCKNAVLADMADHKASDITVVATKVTETPTIYRTEVTVTCKFRPWFNWPPMLKLPSLSKETPVSFKVAMRNVR